MTIDDLTIRLERRASVLRALAGVDDQEALDVIEEVASEIRSNIVNCSQRKTSNGSIPTRDATWVENRVLQVLSARSAGATMSEMQHALREEVNASQVRRAMVSLRNDGWVDLKDVMTTLGRRSTWIVRENPPR